MKKLTYLLTTILLLLLCGCSGDGITDTYWRDDKTGDWLIGLTEDKIIYDCKVWGISSMDESEGKYIIHAKCGSENLDISMGSEQDGKRTITIGGRPFDCSIISGWHLPDYPEKDTCSTIADNHYAEGDSVTIIGMVKPKKGLSRLLDNEKEAKEVIAFLTANILTAEKPTFTAPIDSCGQFKLRIPIENTRSFCLRIGQETDVIAADIVAEPNETYFLMKDQSQGKTLFMGKRARLQNEINAYSIHTSWYGASKLDEIGDIMNILDSIKNNTKTTLKELDQVCSEHPTLSGRYRTYYRNYILTANAYLLMQGMYLLPKYDLPKEYIKTVDEDYWKEFTEPYTMESYEFSSFLNDYCTYLWLRTQDEMPNTMKKILETAEKDGIVKLSAKDREVIRQYDEAFPAYWEKRKNAPDSLKKIIEDEFGKNSFVKGVLEIQARNPDYDEYSNRKFNMRTAEQMVKAMDARGISEMTQDIIICRYFCNYINNSCKSLGNEILTFVDEHIHLPAARNAVNKMNDKYEQIGKSKLSHENNIKSSDEVKNMSDGEKILRKIIKPYKGKIILVDVWGTWCTPCKMRLSNSQEEYKRLKDFDIVYLYLANRSDDKSWKNVIKEYKVEGDNVVHYNLPVEQQSAVESYIGVNAYPTYKLIDCDGKLLDVNADPIDLDALAGLLERMAK